MLTPAWHGAVVGPVRPHLTGECRQRSGSGLRWVRKIVECLGIRKHIGELTTLLGSLMDIVSYAAVVQPSCDRHGRVGTLLTGPHTSQTRTNEQQRCTACFVFPLGQSRHYHQIITGYPCPTVYPNRFITLRIHMRPPCPDAMHTHRPICVL